MGQKGEVKLPSKAKCKRKRKLKRPNAGGRGNSRKIEGIRVPSKAKRASKVLREREREREDGYGERARKGEGLRDR